MKYAITLLSILCIVQLSHAQKKYVTKTASINFEGSVDSFEPIKAINNSATVVLDNAGNLAALALIKGFRFPVALMQEHFNENYMESDEFPKATLRGKLLDFNTFLKDGSQQTLKFKGSLEMHGVINELEMPVQLTFTDSSYTLNTNFDLDSEDYDIVIPAIVRKKISKKMNVTVTAIMQE
jgi:hypothetical protein